MTAFTMQVQSIRRSSVDQKGLQMPTTNPAGRWNLLLLGRRRGAYLMTCRLFDNRKFSPVLRHLELEREFGFGYFLDGNARTDLNIAHFRLGGPVRRVPT